MERRATLADYFLLPEGEPVQLIDYELVRDPSPTYGHQRLVVEILSRLRLLLGPDRVVVSPVDVFVDEGNALWPDVAVTAERLAPETKTIGVPLLVVEVLSPSTAVRDRSVKVAGYLRAGVAEVILVDPMARTIEVATGAGVEPCPGDGTIASRAVPGFALSPRELFA